MNDFESLKPIYKESYSKGKFEPFAKLRKKLKKKKPKKKN